MSTQRDLHSHWRGGGRLYRYDGLGRLSDKLFASFTGTQKVTYAYDGLGRVTSSTDMNGRTVGYQYNAASAVTRTTYNDGSYVSWGLDGAQPRTYAHA